MVGHAVKVVVRCRPLSGAEAKGRHSTVVSCNGKEKQVTVHSEVRGQDTKKTYTFDSVFGEFSQQESVFEDISGIIDEVLEGFNCTVFAYGQTGTGKTYTMQGPVLDDNRSIECGIIPRTIHAIFDRLSGKDVNECVIHVSCLEIYNEEICDLLSATNESDLRIFDDVLKGVFVSNLEEMPVVDPADIFSVLKACWDRRKTAETKMNAASSRSHTIFTVKVHTKEITVDGESIIKIGKLNLVDLAGSECVGKSEAVGQRAKEAGNINRSLLTLGRVINSLVQGQRHIPYRESKLTRLLQESLGGKAKTILIATISPSQRALEETLKTLEYAHTAKNILNRPEVNQKVTQKAFVRDLQLNMSLIKKQLEAQRSKAGVYLPTEQYEGLEKELATSKASLERQGQHMESLHLELTKISEKNQQLRSDAIATKDAHQNEMASLQKAMAEERANWEEKCSNLTTQLMAMTNERDCALEAINRRDKSILDQKQAITSCHSSCSSRISDIRTSLDQLMAQHTQQAKIAVDDVHCWADEITQCTKTMHDGTARITTALRDDLQQLFTLCVKTCEEDGALHTNLAFIKKQVGQMEDRACAAQASIKTACDEHSARTVSDLAKFATAMEEASRRTVLGSSEALELMQEEALNLEGQWAQVVEALSQRQEHSEQRLLQLQKSSLQSFKDKEEVIRIKGEEISKAVSAMMGSFCSDLQSLLSEDAETTDFNLKEIAKDLTSTYLRSRQEVTTCAENDRAVRHLERERLAAIMEDSQSSKDELVSSLATITTSCDDISSSVTTFVNGLGGSLATVSSAAIAMRGPVMAIMEDTQSHKATYEGHHRDLRDMMMSFTTQTGQTCSSHIGSTIAARDQVETTELRYREQHHAGLGEISGLIENLASCPIYASPNRPAPSSSPNKPAPPSSPIKMRTMGRIKRPRDLSIDPDDSENKKPLN